MLLRVIFAILALLAAVPARAETDWTYGDWTATAPHHDSAEDDWLVCTARTGGDGWPILTVIAFEGDVGPPAAYPDIQLHEYAPRHYPTAMQAGQTVRFAFDTGLVAQTLPAVEIDEDGIQNAYAGAVSPASLDWLRAMQAGSRLEVTTGGQPVTTVSLNGFTAAYLKMMELCGFDGTGVTK